MGKIIHIKDKSFLALVDRWLKKDHGRLLGKEEEWQLIEIFDSKRRKETKLKLNQAIIHIPVLHEGKGSFDFLYEKIIH